MPWKVGKKTGKGYEIVNKDTGKVEGYSKTRGEAEAAIKARYAKYKNKAK